MEFKEFDMSGYFQALAAFKQTHTDKIVQRMGSVEQFDALIAGIKGREQEVARNAVRQYGSLERWTQAVEHNLQDYLDNGPSVSPEEVSGLLQKTEELTRALTADLGRDPASAEVQAVTAELVAFSERCSGGMDMGEGYWALMAENYLTNQTYIEVTDKKYGPGAARFLGQALRIYAGA